MGNLNLEGVTILSDEPLQGTAAFIEERRGVDDEALAEQLRAHAVSGGLALPGARGGGPLEAFQRIVRRIRGRTEGEDLGEHELSIDWLTFHVPQGGKGKLKLKQSEEAYFGVQISLLGLGFGSGRRITLSVDQDFKERICCLRLSELVRARVRTFSTDGSGTPTQCQVDVVEILAHQTTALEPCAECLGSGDSMITQAGPAFDSTRDPIGLIQDDEILLEDDSEVELGLPLSIPGLAVDLTPSIAVKRSVHLRCTLHYEFPGGYRFTPYVRSNSWKDLPFWRRD